MKEDLSTPKLNAESLFLFFFWCHTCTNFTHNRFRLCKDNVQNNQRWCPQEGNKAGTDIFHYYEKKSFVFFMSDKEIKSHFVLHSRYLTDLLVSLNVILNYWDWLIGPSYWFNRQPCIFHLSSDVIDWSLGVMCYTMKIAVWYPLELYGLSFTVRFETWTT